jgi:Fe-S cluster assembly iron-binding protein IscA
MVEITEAAHRELDGYFADKEKAPIRIYLSAGGCSGPRLALALDEAKDTDDLFEAGGYQFIVDKDLAVQAAPLRVDMSYMGFSVQSSLELGGGGCGCSGGSCSSGSCGTPGSCCS